MKENSTSTVQKILAGLTIAYGIVNGLIPLSITGIHWAAGASVGSPTLCGVLVLLFSLGVIHGAGGVARLNSKQGAIQVGEACLFFSIPLALATAALLAISGVQPGTFASFGLGWSGWIAATGLVWAVTFKVLSTQIPEAGKAKSQPDTDSSDEEN